MSGERVGCLMWAIVGTEKFTNKPKFAFDPEHDKPYLFPNKEGAIEEINVYRRNRVNHLRTIDPEPVRVFVTIEAAHD